MKITDIPASYKDPSGFVFQSQNILYRQINSSYKDHYDLLIKSGLYQKLTNEKLLIPHEETSLPQLSNNGYKIIKPQLIPFISYPYEWCFSQLKDAALLTLSIQKTALNFSMTLKDATGFNIQFCNGKPIFIDTLSFEKYDEGRPWIAYRQFCQEFLAPLALYCFLNLSLHKLLMTSLEGIQLDLVSKLLPLKSRLNLPIFLHIHLHGKNYQKYSKGKFGDIKQAKFNKISLLGLIDSLETGIKSLKIKKNHSFWSNYYQENDSPSYQLESFDSKKETVKKYLKLIRPKSLWDLGANTGLFSRMASEMGIFTLSLDNDPLVIEKNYLESKKRDDKNILPLIIDITNPTPSLGWENNEKQSLLDRPHPDCVMALALIHHLAIVRNLPLRKISEFFAGICKFLIIEFVPKEDEKVQLLLQNRDDIFPTYTQDFFEKEFTRCFSIKEKSAIPISKRVIYLLQRKKTYKNKR